MSEIATALPPDDGLVPGWLQRLAAVGWRLLAAVALVVVLIGILSILSTVTASVLVAAIVAATFAPFVLALRNRGWSRIKAAAAVFLGAAVVIIATLAIIALAFLPYIKDVVTDLHAGIAAVKTLLTDYNVPPEVASAVENAANGVEAWLSSSATDIAGTIGIVFTIGLLATFLTFFFMMDGDKAWVWVLSSANEWRREAITTSGHVALERVGGYLRGTAVIAAFDGLFEGLFLLILGVPHALPLAVIVFFGRFIPYVGGLVTTLLLLSVTLASQGTTAAFILLVLISILNVIQGKFLAPAIYNKTVHIHPAIVLTALPAGAALAGIVGLFVAIPVVAFALAITGAAIEVLGVDPTARSTANPLVPIWLDRLGQWSWRLLVALALLAVAIAAAVQVPIVVLPLVLGIVLASTLLPLSRRLEARGWSKGRAALGATLGATVGVVLIVGLTIVALAGPANDIVSNAAAGATSSSDALGGQGGALVALVEGFGAGVLLSIAGVLQSLAGLAVIVFLAVLLTFYFLRDGDTFWATFLRRIEPGRRSYIDAAGTSRGQRARRLHARDGCDLGLRRRDPVPDHGRPGHPAGVAAGHPGRLRRVHPVHRVADHHRSCIPRHRRDRIAPGHPDHGHLHDRLQHRAGQHRGADRLQPGREPAPGGRPRRDPGRQRGCRGHRHVPRRAVPRCRSPRSGGPSCTSSTPSPSGSTTRVPA